MATKKRQTAVRFDAETDRMVTVLAERQASTANRVITDAIRYYYANEMQRYAEADAENAELNRLTATLSDEHRMYLFVGLPMQTNEDSPTVEHFLLSAWQKPVTVANMTNFRHAFVTWRNNGYKESAQ